VVIVLFLSVLLYCQSITVGYPNGGETLIMGETATIKWKVVMVSSNLDVLLERDGRVVGTIVSGISGLRTSYNWTIGEYKGGSVSPGSGYKVIVTAPKMKRVSDKSDNPFTIRSASDYMALPGKSSSHDFDIVEAYVNEHCQLMVVVNDRTSDYSGPLTFSLEPSSTRYSVASVSLTRGRDQEIEVGAMPSSLADACKNDFSIVVNADRSISERNWINNTLKTRLPFYRDYLWIFVTVQTTQLRAFIQGNEVRPEIGSTIRLRSDLSDSVKKKVSVTVMNCGCNPVDGILYVVQEGRWWDDDRRGGSFDEPPRHSVKIGDWSFNVDTGVGGSGGDTHRTSLVEIAEGVLIVQLFIPGFSPNPTWEIRLTR
jgi:hypothetical protein